MNHFWAKITICKCLVSLIRHSNWKSIAVDSLFLCLMTYLYFCDIFFFVIKSESTNKQQIHIFSLKMSFWCRERPRVPPDNVSPPHHAVQSAFIFSGQRMAMKLTDMFDWWKFDTLNFHPTPRIHFSVCPFVCLSPFVTWLTHYSVFFWNLTQLWQPFTKT